MRKFFAILLLTVLLSCVGCSKTSIFRETEANQAKSQNNENFGVSSADIDDIFVSSSEESDNSASYTSSDQITVSSKNDTSSEINTSSEVSETATAQIEVDEKSDYVWVPTKGGQKYHKNNKCSGMKEPQCILKTTAEADGFTPCKKCYK